MTEFRMEVERERGEPLGAQVDDQLKIVRILPSALVKGVLMAGDIILSVNEQRVKTKVQLFQLLRTAYPRVRVHVRRPVPSSSSSSSLSNIGGGIKPLSQESERLVRRRPGFDYLQVDINWESSKHRQLGISLTNRANRGVIVTNLKGGSLGEEKLKPLDRCVAINNTPVADKDVAKQIIVQCGGKFTMIVERPLTDDAKRELQAKSEDKMSSSQTPSTIDQYGLGKGDTTILPADVLEITRLAIIKRREGPVIVRKSILKSSSTSSKQTDNSTTRLFIQSRSREHSISSDVNPASKTSHVPKADPGDILPKEF